MEHPADVTSAGIQKLDGRSLPAIALKVGQYGPVRPQDQAAGSDPLEG